MRGLKAKQFTPNIRLALIAFAFMLWNLGMLGFRLWKSFWWLGLLVIFLFIVALAKGLGNRISTRSKKIYERALAVGFPILLLLAWELIVGAEILNPRWFPPPSRIGVALWELAVKYRWRKFGFSLKIKKQSLNFTCNTIRWEPMLTHRHLNNLLV